MESEPVLLSYACVLLRKLCFLSVEALEMARQPRVLALLVRVLQIFMDDAILQAAACGCVAAVAQASSAGRLALLSQADVVATCLDALFAHREYSTLTRQVHIYACEGKGRWPLQWNEIETE